MGEEQEEEGRSLFETPTWAVATVITVMVSVGFLVQGCLTLFGKWLTGTKRKALLAALEKIKDELMLFGVLSLLMGHWTILVSKICIKSSSMSSKFYPCTLEGYYKVAVHQETLLIAGVHSSNHSVLHNHIKSARYEHCPEGREPFASYESLEQLHRLLFVLGVVHVSYNFGTIVLAMLKLYSWRSWESQARSMVIQGLQGSPGDEMKNLGRLSTFIFHHTSHPWSRRKILVWMLCFSRQFWSSINRADYMALRMGFLTSHGLHLSYDFHSYMLRSMEDEFRDIVGISVPLWIYAILCIFLNFHGTNLYFWLSFVPAILALEITDTNSSTGNQFNLRDDLFWFGNPKFLLWLIHLISFQNAFEMATFIWSLWEIKGPDCFMENRAYIVIRLTSGVIFQFWCSYITFPLYVIITQMGSRFKKSVVAENVRKSLHGWRKRAKRSRDDHSHVSHETATSVTSSVVDEMNTSMNLRSEYGGSSSSQIAGYVAGSEINEQAPSSDEDSYTSHGSGPLYDSYTEEDDDDKDEACLFPRKEVV